MRSAPRGGEQAALCRALHKALLWYEEHCVRKGSEKGKHAQEQDCTLLQGLRARHASEWCAVHHHYTAVQKIQREGRGANSRLA